MGGASHSWAAARAHDGAPARELPVHGGHLPRRRGGPAGAVHRDGPGAPESTRDASGAELLPERFRDDELTTPLIEVHIIENTPGISAHH